MKSIGIRFLTAVSLILAALPAARAEVPSFSPPHWDMVDSNGVELNSGSVEFKIAPVSIGASDNKFAFWETYTNNLDFPTKGLFGSITAGSLMTYGSGSMVVKVLDKTEVFLPNTDGTYRSWSHDGGLLTLVATDTLQYTDRDGVVYSFDKAPVPLSKCVNLVIQQNGAIYEIETLTPICSGSLTTVTYPDGRVTSLARGNGWYVRNDGFMLKTEGIAVPDTQHMLPVKYRLSKLMAVNAAFDYCDTTQTSCSFSRPWPTATFAWTGEIDAYPQTQTMTLTDPAQRKTVYTVEVLNGVPQGYIYRAVVNIKAPTSTGANTTDYFWTSGYNCVPDSAGLSWDCTATRQPMLFEVHTAQGKWSYTYTWQCNQNCPPQALQTGLWQTDATRPDGFSTSSLYNIKTGYIWRVTGTNGRLDYDYNWPNELNRLQSSTDSEGRVFNYTYDDRGNILTKSQISSTKGDAPLVMQANYDPVCNNQVTCNKPNWVKDANLNETDYTYDPVHGGTLTETGPAVDGIRPQKRYTYVQRYPWLKNSAGGYSRGPNPIWVRNTLSYCKTSNVGASGTGCTASNDEVVTTYDYGPDSGPNNLFLRGQTVAADGAVHRICYGYDPLGNKISETTANAGLTSCP